MGKQSIASSSRMRVLRFPDVKEKVGYSRMHVDRLEKAGKFPKRMQLGDNSVGWLEGEIDDWIASKAKARGSGPSKGNSAAERG